MPSVVREQFQTFSGRGFFDLAATPSRTTFFNYFTRPQMAARFAKHEVPGALAFEKYLHQHGTDDLHDKFSTMPKNVRKFIAREIELAASIWCEVRHGAYVENKAYYDVFVRGFLSLIAASSTSLRQMPRPLTSEACRSYFSDLYKLDTEFSALADAARSEDSEPVQYNI